MDLSQDKCRDYSTSFDTNFRNIDFTMSTKITQHPDPKFIRQKQMLKINYRQRAISVKSVTRRYCLIAAKIWI